MKIEGLINVNGGESYTTLDGVANGDYLGDGWLYSYASGCYYYENESGNYGGSGGSYCP